MMVKHGEVLLLHVKLGMDALVVKNPEVRHPGDPSLHISAEEDIRLMIQAAEA